LTRLPTIARIALLSIALVLVTNFALIAFIRYQTYDNALTQLHQDITSDAVILRDLYNSSGLSSLRQAVDDTVHDEPDKAIALMNYQGRITIGNVTQLPADFRFDVAGFHTGYLRLVNKAKPATFRFLMTRLDKQNWLLNGNQLDDRLALQATLERSLLFAFILSITMGIIGGLAVAHYVGMRVARIASVVDAIGAGNFGSRATVTGSGDAFDKLSSRINDMLSRITFLMDELRIITDSLAHDLRSPVSRLRARIEQALTEKEQAKRNQLLAGVLTETDSLMRMLTTVLEIGRSKAMTGVSQFEIIDPEIFIEELSDMYEPLTDERGIALGMDIAEGSPTFHGHRQLLAQAMSNLIDNALRYGAAGGNITLGIDTQSAEIRLIVSDNGVGIKPIDMQQARKRYGRLDSSRSIPGAGLGLSLVEAVAQLHKGQLELFDNAPGLRVEIVIPFIAYDAPPHSP
jgi:signal transduction histidine kinase